jgi:hypothetical protein
MGASTDGFFEAYTSPRGGRHPVWAQPPGPPREAGRVFEARRQKLRRMIAERGLSSAARAAQADHARATMSLHRDSKEWEHKMKQSLTAMQAQRRDLSEVRKTLQEVLDPTPKRKTLRSFTISKRLTIARTNTVAQMRRPKIINRVTSAVSSSDSSSCSSNGSRSPARNVRLPSVFHEHFGKKRGRKNADCTGA